MSCISRFGPLRTKAKFTPLFYYKIIIISIKMYWLFTMIKWCGQKDRGHVCWMFSLGWLWFEGVKETIGYITKIGNKSPHIPYYGQWLWPWNIFKWLCVFPLLRPGLCDGRSAVTSLEHNRTDITQHLLLTLCNQRAARAKSLPHHLAKTDCQRSCCCACIGQIVQFFLSRNNDS